MIASIFNLTFFNVFYSIKIVIAIFLLILHNAFLHKGFAHCMSVTFVLFVNALSK